VNPCRIGDRLIRVVLVIQLHVPNSLSHPGPLNAKGEGKGQIVYSKEQLHSVLQMEKN